MGFEGFESVKGVGPRVEEGRRKRERECGEGGFKGKEREREREN